jgi:hypothetical protein
VTPEPLARDPLIGQTQAVARTVRCPECQRRNQIPVGAEAKARCGVCRAPLIPTPGRPLEATEPAGVSGASDTSGPPGTFGARGFGGPRSDSGRGGAGSPWGPGGPPGPVSPWGPGGAGGAGAPWGGASDAAVDRMRQTRRTARTPSTSGTGRRPSRLDIPSARPGDPRAVLVQRWDELLRLVPADMGLSAALGEGAARSASDPITWLSAAADVPRQALDQVRHVRNCVAWNRPVPDREISRALETVDRALGVLGRTRLPE